MRSPQLMAPSGTGPQGRPSIHVLGGLLLLLALLPAAGQPSVVLEPQDQTVCIGGDATFYVEAVGSNMNFIWYSNAVPVFLEFDVTNSFFTVTNVQPANSNDQFYVFISSPSGPTQSSNAYLFVLDPGICKQPTNTVVPPGGTISFSVIASGTLPLYYQWSKVILLTNDVPILGADLPDLVITNAAASDTGFYRVVVTNHWGAVTSVLAHCFVGIPPTVGNPPSRIVRFNASTLFSAAYTGTQPRYYQWYRNDAPIAGATNLSLLLSNIQRPEVGVYHVVVTNGAGAATSGKAHLQVRLTLESTSPIFREEATDELPNLTNAVVVFAMTDTAVYHGVPLLFTTHNATAEPGKTNCDIPASHTMWVRYDSPDARPTRVSTEGSGFDTVVSVYTWNGGPELSPVECDNDSGYDGQTSLLYFNPVAGQRYYIVVDGVGGVTGTVRLQIGETLRKMTFNRTNGTFRFELAGPFWFTNTLRSFTNLAAPSSNWPLLLTIPPTNRDWLIGYTNFNVLADQQRFYTVRVSTNTPP